MSDFSQTGEVATLHRLGNRPVESLESDLSVFSRIQPISLVLPARPCFSAAFRSPLEHLHDLEFAAYTLRLTMRLGGAFRLRTLGRGEEFALPA